MHVCFIQEPHALKCARLRNRRWQNHPHRGGNHSMNLSTSYRQQPCVTSVCLSIGSPMPTPLVSCWGLLIVFCSITGIEIRSSLTDMTPEASISGSMLDLGQVRLRKQTEKIKLKTRNKKPSSHWASRLGRRMSNKDYYFARFVAVSSSMNGCSPQLRSSCCRAKGATCGSCRAEGAT